MNDFEKIKLALLSKGMSEKQADKEAKKLVKDGVTFEQIIKEFVKKADNDPSTINSNNCSDGKCCASEINWKK